MDRLPHRSTRALLADLSERMRKEFPSIELDKPSDLMGEIGLCDICGTTIDKTVDTYLVWDGSTGSQNGERLWEVDTR